MYDRIKKLKFFRDAARSNLIAVLPQNESEEASSTEVARDINSGEHQHNVEGRDSINFLSRLSKLENDNINILKKLDDIAAANITRFSKIEEDNNKLFKQLQEILNKKL